MGKIERELIYDEFANSYITPHDGKVQSYYCPKCHAYFWLHNAPDQPVGHDYEHERWIMRDASSNERLAHRICLLCGKEASWMKVPWQDVPTSLIAKNEKAKQFYNSLLASSETARKYLKPLEGVKT